MMEEWRDRKGGRKRAYHFLSIFTFSLPFSFILLFQFLYYSSSFSYASIILLPASCLFPPSLHCIAIFCILQSFNLFPSLPSFSSPFTFHHLSPLLSPPLFLLSFFPLKHFVKFSFFLTFILHPVFFLHPLPPLLPFLHSFKSCHPCFFLSFSHVALTHSLSMHLSLSMTGRLLLSQSPCFSFSLFFVCS